MTFATKTGLSVDTIFKSFFFSFHISIGLCPPLSTGDSDKGDKRSQRPERQAFRSGDETKLEMTKAIACISPFCQFAISFVTGWKRPLGKGFGVLSPLSLSLEERGG